MVYIISFVDSDNKQYNNYFTIVDKKMSKDIVYKAIEENNKKFGYAYKIDKISTNKGMNIVEFQGETDKCIIWRLGENKEPEVKKNSKYEFVSLDSESIRYNKPKYIKDNDDSISFRGVEYDSSFCKCLFKVNEDYVIRYGEPFNDGFNTSINNKRIQVRFSDGAIRFRDLDMSKLREE